MVEFDEIDMDKSNSRCLKYYLIAVIYDKSGMYN